MYDINIKNVKRGKGNYIAFLIAGIVFLGLFGGIYYSNISDEKRMDAQTMSTKVEINTKRDSDGEIMYSPIYYYEVEGKEYTCSSNMSSNLKPSTQNKEVKYNSSNPEDCLSDYTKSGNKYLLIALLLPVLFITIAIFGMIKINKRIKKINALNQYGKLVKNLPYRMEDTGTVVNNVPIQRPVVDYPLPSGSTITLYGDPRNDRKFADSDGLVDVIIDENDLTNYYIDFEINRLTGNLPQDYYSGTNTPKQ